MDPVIGTIVVVAILALVAVGAFFVYRQRIKVDLTGPGGTNLRIDGSNDPAPTKPGIEIDTAIAHKGDVITEDQTARGIKAGRLEAGDTVRTTLSQPENDRPKA
jgi:hypothetical protein